MNPFQNIYPSTVLLSYTKDPKTGQLRILEENHYYPGACPERSRRRLKHEVYTPPTSKGLIADRDVPGQTQVSIIRETEYMYKYNGKEWQDELNLNWYDYGWRNYMPDLGRWVTQDPLLNDLRTTINFDRADNSNDEIDKLVALSSKMEIGGGVYNPDNLNPYSYGYNNPVTFDDPDGRCPVCIGAVVGALIGAGIEAGLQYIEHGEVTDWKAVVASGADGAITGAVAAATGGTSLFTSVMANGSASMVGGMVESTINGEEITLSDASVDAMSGAAGGAVANKVEKAVNNVIANKMSSSLVKTAVEKGTAGGARGITKSTVKEGGKALTSKPNIKESGLRNSEIKMDGGIQAADSKRHNAIPKKVFEKKLDSLKRVK